MVALLQGDSVARFALPAIPGESPPPTTGLASVMAVPPPAAPAAPVTSTEPRIPAPREHSSSLPPATGVTSEADQYNMRPKTGILLSPPIIDESLSADLQGWTSRTATTSSTAPPSASAASTATTAATAQQATVDNVKSLPAGEPVEESGGIGGTFEPGSEASRSPAKQATYLSGGEQPDLKVPLPLLPHLREEHPAVASQSADRSFEEALPTGTQANLGTTQMGGQSPSGPSSAAGPLSGVAGSGYRQQLQDPLPVAMTAMRGIESRASGGTATRRGDEQQTGQSVSADPLAGRMGRSETRTLVPPLSVRAVGRVPDADGDEGEEQDYGPLGPLG